MAGLEPRSAYTSQLTAGCRNPMISDDLDSQGSFSIVHDVLIHKGEWVIPPKWAVSYQ